MLEAKDVARKIASGCGHTATVVVPCSGCIETQMHGWASAIREETKREFRDQWNEVVDERDRARIEASSDRAKVDGMASAIDRLKAEVARLSGLLKEARQQVEDLKVQLHAEQAFKQAVKLAAPKVKAAAR